VGPAPWYLLKYQGTGKREAICVVDGEQRMAGKVCSNQAHDSRVTQCTVRTRHHGKQHPDHEVHFLHAGQIDRRVVEVPGRVDHWTCEGRISFVKETGNWSVIRLVAISKSWLAHVAVTASKLDGWRVHMMVSRRRIDGSSGRFSSRECKKLYGVKCGSTLVVVQKCDVVMHIKPHSVLPVHITRYQQTT
jgi:hypothetical protein